MTISERKAQRQKAAKLLESGETMATIAARLGVSRQTVSKWAREMGLRRYKKQIFIRERYVLECVLDETATFWALVQEFRPLEEQAHAAKAIADILINFPLHIKCEKQYNKLAGIILWRANLLRILADYAAASYDARKIFDCIVYIEQITVSILSELE